MKIPYPQLFRNKIYWKKWIVLLLVMILYLLIGSYLQYGNLKIRESFQLVSIINSVLFVGITEETVFRGWILNSLLTKINMWVRWSYHQHYLLSYIFQHGLYRKLYR